MRDRHQRELDALRKSHRRDQFRLYGFLSIWLGFILYLPFAPSFNEVLVAFGLYTLGFSIFIFSLMLK